jgi:hypothetical protein
VAYAFVLVLAGAGRLFFLLDGHSLLSRAFSALWGGIKLVLLATLGSALASPFLAYWLVKRSAQTAQQTTGWKVSFLSPWLFSGVPVYRPEYFVGLSDRAPIYWYLAFFAILLILARLVALSAGPGPAARSEEGAAPSNIDIKSINSITLLFIITIIIYIIGYYIFDNRYQVWKFAAYAGLPLSFVPTALLAIFICRAKSSILKGLSLGLLVFLTLTIGIGVDCLKNLIMFPKKFYNIMSIKAYYEIIHDILSKRNNNTYIIINVQGREPSLRYANFFENSKKLKFIMLSGHYIFRTINLMPFILSKHMNYVIITDKKYDNLYNNGINKNISSILYVYDYEWINNHGYVEVTGINWADDWSINKDWVLLKILAPRELRGKDARLSVTLNGGVNASAKELKVRLTFAGQTVDEALLADRQSLTTLVKGSATENGLIIVGVLLEDGSKKEPGQGSVIFEKVELKQVN